MSFLARLLPGFCMCICGVALADGQEDIAQRCMSEVGEFGDAMVRACVEEDVAAAKALASYPRATREIVARCGERWQGRGASMVKQCADRDIEADAALARYEKEQGEVLRKCQQKWAEQGAAKVKECVEREVGGQ